MPIFPEKFAENSRALRSTRAENGKRKESKRRSRAPADRRRRRRKATMGGHDGKFCANCGTTSTPKWRKDRTNNDTILCNACGLKKKRHGREKTEGETEAVHARGEEGEETGRTTTIQEDACREGVAQGGGSEIQEDG